MFDFDSSGLRKSKYYMTPNEEKELSSISGVELNPQLSNIYIELAFMPEIVTSEMLFVIMIYQRGIQIKITYQFSNLRTDIKCSERS